MGLHHDGAFQGCALDNFPDSATFLPLDILGIQNKEAFREVWQRATSNCIKSFQAFTAPPTIVLADETKSNNKKVKA